MNPSEMSVQYVMGGGEKKAQVLKKLGIETVFDLVHYFPRSYIDLTNQLKINEIVPETVCCFRATVGFDCTSARESSGMIIYKTTVFDETGTVHITIFNNKSFNFTKKINIRIDCFHAQTKFLTENMRNFICHIQTDTIYVILFHPGLTHTNQILSYGFVVGVKFWHIIIKSKGIKLFFPCCAISQFQRPLIDHKPVLIF